MVTAASGGVHLYGLQRSGTNALTVYLKNNFNVSIQRGAHELKSPHNKHFRPYFKRDAIPSTDYRFELDPITQISDLDRVLGVNNDHLYIIIFKPLGLWMRSILSYVKYIHDHTKHSGWSARAERLARDHACYVEFWTDLAQRHPDRILLIKFVDFIGDENALNHRLGLFLKIDPLGSTRASHVPMSDTFSKKNRIRALTPIDVKHQTC